MSGVTIRKYSPHLASVVTRLFDAQALEQIAPIFHWCIEQGGLDELDFGREEGASYNPRPARVALILINDAASRDLTSVGAAIIAAGLEGSAFEPDGSQFQQLAEARAELAARPLAELVKLSDEDICEAGTIACCLWLDRARHLHLSQGQDRALWEWACEENNRARELATRYRLSLIPLLDNFGARAMSRGRKLS